MKGKLIILLGFVVAVVAIVVFTLQGRKDGGGDDAGQKPDGKAPTAAGVEITMLYGTEKEDWLKSCLTAFQAAHPEIAVKLVGMGSLDGVNAILDGKEKPTIFSPADSLALALLDSDWEAKNHTSIISKDGPDRPEPLVITPLVFAIWEDRATVLQKAGNGSVTWKSIHDAVASNQGWPAIGGKAEWGFVKLGHTDPTRSNSGLQALLLMTLEYYNKSAGLTVADVLDPGYQAWVAETEKGVGKFETSTGTFMTDMVRFGPSRFDIAVVYENLAVGQIENAQGRWGNLKIYYPATTLWSDHPLAILQADWVSPEQKEAARTWSQWLRSREMQQKALAYGFRPGDPSVPVLSGDASNPFQRYATYGVKVEVPPVATLPDGAVLRNLMTMWSRVVQTR